MKEATEAAAVKARMGAEVAQRMAKSRQKEIEAALKKAKVKLLVERKRCSEADKRLTKAGRLAVEAFDLLWSSTQEKIAFSKGAYFLD